jgi:integrase/recombinase XerD
LDETGLKAVLPVAQSGCVYVAGSVPLLHPETQIVDEMLEGWRNQQLCRNLALDTIDGRVRLVERFLAYTNEFPWTWTPAVARRILR